MFTLTFVCSDIFCIISIGGIDRAVEEGVAREPKGGARFQASKVVAKECH